MNKIVVNVYSASIAFIIAIFSLKKSLNYNNLLKHAAHLEKWDLKLLSKIFKHTLPKILSKNEQTLSNPNSFP